MTAVALIPLWHGRRVVNEAIVDAEDAWVGEHIWFTITVHRMTCEWGYAIRNVGGRAVGMHRLLLGLAPGDVRVGHHRNQVKFDNRRSNLVVCADRFEHTRLPHPATTEQLAIRGRLLLFAFGSEVWNEAAA